MTPTTSWQTVELVTINVPGIGKVHIVGNASVNIPYGEASPVYLGIAVNDGGTPSHIVARVNTYDADVGATLAMTTQWVTTVTAGSHTFYLVTMRNGTSGTFGVTRPQISASFFPE